VKGLLQKGAFSFGAVHPVIASPKR
jgi:hypothetical protein